MTETEQVRLVAGREHDPGQLHEAARESGDASLWAAIGALETEAEVTGLLAGDGDEGLKRQADQAERDARLLRRLATARRAGTQAESAPCGRVSAAIRAVSQFLVAEVSLGDTLRRIAAVARETIAGPGAASITLLDEKEQAYGAVWVGDLSPRADDVQYSAAEGPCFHALRQGRAVGVDDTRLPGPWPAFRRQAVADGIRSARSLPLVAAGDAYGALNLYAASENAFANEDAQAFTEFATQAAVVLANARAYWRAFDLSEGLKQAMETRSAIEQAKGIIIATNSCGADEAFDILVRASQRENVKVREIARRIVEHHGKSAQPNP